MSNSTPDQRIKRYTNGINPTRISEDFTTQKPDMVAAETVRFNEQYQVEQQVHEICQTDGIVSFDFAKYQTFAKVLAKLVKKYSGKTIITECALLITVWTARGCLVGTLDKIRDNVFNVPPSVTP